MYSKKNFGIVLNVFAWAHLIFISVKEEESRTWSIIIYSYAKMYSIYVTDKRRKVINTSSFLHVHKARLFPSSAPLLCTIQRLQKSRIIQYINRKTQGQGAFYMQIRFSLVWSIVTGASPLLFSKIETLYKDIENKSTDGMKM